MGNRAFAAVRETKKLFFAYIGAMSTPVFAGGQVLLCGFFGRAWPSLENLLRELKTVLPNADFIIEGYVDPVEPLRDEGPFGDHID